MWRMFSCLRCCPRQKLRMTEDFSIPSLQRSSVPSNIQKQLRSSFHSLFMCCTQISSKNFWSNSCWDACSYSPTPPWLLVSGWTCIWLQQHLTQCPSRTYHDKGISNTYLPPILVTVSSRSQSICFKALQLLLSNLVLTVENREMHRYAAWHQWLLTRLRMLPYRYVITVFSFIDFWHKTLNRHALLWARQVHGPISMGRSFIRISTGE